MSWFIFACGVLLAIGGAVSIVSGAPYMQIEFGWTEVIAGTTALAGGIVTIALGAVLLRLAALQRALSASAASVPLASSAALPPMAAYPADRPALPDILAQQPDLSGPDPSIPPSYAPDPGVPAIETAPEEPRRRPMPSVIDPTPPRPSLFAGLKSRLGAGRKEAQTNPVSASMLPIEAPPLLRTSPPTDGEMTTDQAPSIAVGIEPAIEDEPAPASPTEPFRRVGLEDVGAREVVGRYEAGGASYVLFSDGTIEVETTNGTHRFASMEELKSFVERQDADNTGLGF